MQPSELAALVQQTADATRRQLEEHFLAALTAGRGVPPPPPSTTPTTASGSGATSLPDAMRGESGTATAAIATRPVLAATVETKPNKRPASQDDDHDDDVARTNSVRAGRQNSPGGPDGEDSNRRSTCTCHESDEQPPIRKRRSREEERRRQRQLWREMAADAWWDSARRRFGAVHHELDGREAAELGLELETWRIKFRSTFGGGKAVVDE